MKINTKFNHADPVIIKELKLNGRVGSILIDKGGVSYSVRYFFNSEPKNAYFYEDELEPGELTKELGFNKLA